MAKKKYYDGGMRGPSYDGGASGGPSDIFPKDVKFMDAKDPCGGLKGPLGDSMQAIDARAKEVEKKVNKQKRAPYLQGRQGSM